MNLHVYSYSVTTKTMSNKMLKYKIQGLGFLPMRTGLGYFPFSWLADRMINMSIELATEFNEYISAYIAARRKYET